MSHKPGHFDSVENGGYLIDSALSEKEWDLLISGKFGSKNRSQWRYIVPPGKKYGVFIVPAVPMKNESIETVMALSEDERDLEAERELNKHVYTHKQLDIWNTKLNPPDKLKSFDDIFDVITVDDLNGLNAIMGRGPTPIPVNDWSLDEFKLEIEDLGLDQIGLDQRYLDGEEEITGAVLELKRVELANKTFKAYDDRTEEDLDFLKADVVDEMIATQGYTEEARTGLTQMVDAYMFFNMDINPNTNKLMQLERRDIREGIFLNPYYSIGIDYLEDVTNNLNVSPDVMTRRDFIWAAVESGIDSGRVSPEVKTMLLFAGRYGIEDMPTEGMTRAKQQQAAEQLLISLNLAERDEEGTVIWDDSLTQIYGQGVREGYPYLAIHIAENISEEWFRKLDDNLEPYYDNMREEDNSPQKVLDELANKTRTGDVKRDPADIYAIVGFSALEDKDMYQDFLDFNWDYNKSAESNLIDYLNTTEFTGPNGLPFTYDLNKAASWLQFEGDGRFIEDDIIKAARKARTAAIDQYTATRPNTYGELYQEQLDAGEVSIHTAYNMFKFFRGGIGENAEILTNSIFQQVSAEETAQWKEDIATSWKKREAHAIEYLKQFQQIENNGGHTQRDIDAIKDKITLGKYSSFNDMLNDEALGQAVLARWQENQTLAFIDPTEYENFDKTSALLEKIAKTGARGQDEYLGWQNAKAEDKAALYDLLSQNQYESQHAALNDPEFRSAMGQVMQAGYGNYEASAFSTYQGKLTGNITSRFRDLGIINANTSSEFYDFLNTNIIPDIKLQAEMAGIQSDATLEVLISNIVGNSQAEYDAFVRQMDSSTPPAAPGMPKGIPSQPIRRQPAPELAPVFDLTGMTPALLEIAEERPEYATWLQGQMDSSTPEGQAFQQAWDEASRPTPAPFDEEQYERETGLTEEQKAEGFTRPPIGYKPYAEEAAKKRWEGLPDIDLDFPTAPEGTEPFDVDKFTAAAKSAAYEATPAAARERATGVPTPGMTQQEFFESRLPGFEDQFKLTREFQIAENRRLADRRRLLATGRGGGGRAFSVFRRGRR